MDSEFTLAVGQLLATFCVGIAGTGIIAGIVSLYLARANRVKLEAEASAISSGSAVGENASAIDGAMQLINELQEEHKTLRIELTGMRGQLRSLEQNNREKDEMIADLRLELKATQAALRRAEVKIANLEEENERLKENSSL